MAATAESRFGGIQLLWKRADKEIPRNPPSAKMGGDEHWEYVKKSSRRFVHSARECPRRAGSGPKSRVAGTGHGVWEGSVASENDSEIVKISHSLTHISKNKKRKLLRDNTTVEFSKNRFSSLKNTFKSIEYKGKTCRLEKTVELFARSDRLYGFKCANYNVILKYFSIKKLLFILQYMANTILKRCFISTFPSIPKKS